ncbi:MAG TPA: hypothetical protein VE863_21775 [Pyrinomonadaceae bacterium]|jgi:opacity protein-like surface antigen|nr:hypothetical protein [Pyrinomonadaceae bacterium]
MRLFLLFLVAFICAPVVLAQSDDVKHYEFYGGYAYQRANNNAPSFDQNGAARFNGAPVVFNQRDQNYNGFTAEFNQNLSRHWGLVTSFTGVYSRTAYVNVVTGRAFGARTSRYDLLFGPRYNFRAGAVNPFAEAMAGFEHMRVNFSDVLTNGDRADTAFAMAFGGGVDVRVSEHVDVRPIQADYIPTFFNSTHQNNYRVSAGVKVKFGQDP